MKRDILCTLCGHGPRPFAGVTASSDPMVLAEMQATGEGLKRVRGTLRRDVQCDGCGTDIEIGNPAVAQSIYNNTAPYYAWEGEYLFDLQPGGGGEPETNAVPAHRPGCTAWQGREAKC